MAERIFAFKVPLSTASPGLTDAQLAKRRQEVRQEIAVIMPSLSGLLGSGVEERIESDGEFIYLCFDLVESSQLHLIYYRGDAGRASPMAQLYADLANLKREAGEHVLRIGEISHIASMIPSLTDAQLEELRSRLSDEDLRQLKTAMTMRGRHIEVNFSNMSISQQMPLLPTVMPEKAYRLVRFKVLDYDKASASIHILEEIPSSTTMSKWGDLCKKKIRLNRRVASKYRKRSVWMLICFAADAGLEVKAEVQAAVAPADLKPVFLELREVLNKKDLVENLQQAINMLDDESDS